MHIDIAWNNVNLNYLAVSSTNGNISVFDIESSVLQKSPGKNPKSIWNGATGTTRSVHKLDWCEHDSSTLLSANQDGIIRIFDTRIGTTSKSNSCQDFNPKCDAIRDVQFSNSSEFIFAAISDNGTLSVWDRRNLDVSVIKFLAHTNSGLTLAYHPSKDSIIATGGKDKYLKVWDLSEVDESNSHNNAPLKPIHSIRTPGQCNRIQWRGKKHSPSSSNNNNNNKDSIHSMSSHSPSVYDSQIASCSNERNDIYIWNLNFPYIPVCVLSGHTDTCVDFRWVDTPKDPSMTMKELFQVSRRISCLFVI